MFESDLEKDIKIIRVFIEMVTKNMDDHFVMGGAVRDRYDYNDIDIYSISEIKAKTLTSKFKKIFNVLAETQNALTIEIPAVSAPVQIVMNTFGTPEEIASTFDFKMNTGFCFFDGRINTVRNDHSLKVCENPLTPETLMYRTFKFLDKKYGIDKGEYLKLLEIHKESIENMDTEWLTIKQLASKYAKKENIINNHFKDNKEPEVIIPF